MTRDWNSLIRYALEGPEGEPFLRLLKVRLRTGSQVVSVRLEHVGEKPEYVLLLSLHKQLSEMRVPHSEAFTNWSFDTGTRMADEQQEQERFVLLIGERLTALAIDVGPDALMFLLANHLHALGAPRSSEAARHLRSPRQVDIAVRRAAEKLDFILVGLARALGRSLKYDEATTGRILDGALAQWISQQPPMLGLDAPHPL
ncbi:hypothetical protein [Corallococcus exercitus]|uniref:Uncharacterized protein n=1 Tax=Corallococcus exercitus TaxID=2316736 RepID=A0A7Y4JU88_9BACT|nr:hypothetical protein [Corallococcus exercitus]NOK11129.1 hypothetical protein [Corallococcus exercitus]